MLKEAQVQSYSPCGANVLSCGRIGATWQIRLNRPSAAAMRPYVKLLWPLVIIVVLVRPHRSTMYADASCCYRPSSVVCRSVYRSPALVSPAKPTKMPFGLSAGMGPRNHVSCV